MLLLRIHYNEDAEVLLYCPCEMLHFNVEFHTFTARLELFLLVINNDSQVVPRTHSLTQL